MGLGILCYFCGENVNQRFCKCCLNQLQPEFNFLPVLPNISLGGYLFDYSEAFRQAIHDIKFHANIELAAWLKNTGYLNCIPPIYSDVDLVVTVPSFWLKQLFRGVPHIPFLFDSYLSQHNLKKTVLRRHQFGQSSFRLNRKERQSRAIKTRFSWHHNEKVSSVTIIDDICTTGSTFIELAQLLKSYGVKTVYVLSLAYRSL
jgi:ComF family protein